MQHSQLKLSDRQIIDTLIKNKKTKAEIAGRLKTFADSGFHVSTETIYKWIYALASKGAPLFMYLRTLEKPRKRRRGKDKRRKPCKNKNN